MKNKLIKFTIVIAIAFWIWIGNAIIDYEREDKHKEIPKFYNWNPFWPIGLMLNRKSWERVNLRR